MKAAHNGTCQICGALQAAAPKNSVLALHGYTTRWGFFSGICSGSKALPFELSKDLIEDAITRHQALAVELVAEAKALRASSDGDTTWVHVYLPAKRLGRSTVPSRYEWQRKQLMLTASVTGRNFWGYHVTDDSGATKLTELPVYFGKSELSDIVAKQNAEYANVLDKRAAEVKLYVQWQQARIANWAVAELKPRTEEAKKPTTRTVGARVEALVTVNGARAWVAGEVLSSHSQYFVMVRVKLDNGKVIEVRQSWLRLVKAEVAA